MIALCCEEEPARRKMLSLPLDGCQVHGEGGAGCDLAVVRSGGVEAFDGGPDGQYVVDNGVDAQ